MEEINENIQEQEVQHEENLEFIADTPKEEKESCTSPKCNCNMIHWIVEGVLLLAVIALFILHFVGTKGGDTSDNGNAPAVKVATKPGNGNILYVNLDTIYECDLFEEKQAVLDEESKKLENTFTTRQKKLENGLKNMLGIKAHVSLVAPKTIERSEGKAKRVIDNRKI